MKFALAVVAVCCALAPTAAVNGQALTTDPQELVSGSASQTRSDMASTREMEILAERLFDATVGREPSSTELAQATGELQNGRLRSLVEAIVGSSEYRARRSRMGVRATLQQFYRSLLGRDPDAAGARTFEQRLARGYDTDVLLEIIGSEEFQERLEGEETTVGPAEQACIDAVGRKITADRRMQVGLRLRNIEIESSSFLYETISGRAEIVSSSALVDFSCQVQRLDQRVTEVDYEILDDPQAATVSEQGIRCESRDNRHRRCEIEPGGTVTLRRQLSRTPCVEGQNWGSDGNSIWVDRGCRADFLVTYIAVAGSSGLAQSLSGWGFVRQLDGRGMWVSAADVELARGGRAEIRFSGDESATFAGQWFSNGAQKIELTLDGALGDSRAQGAGGIQLKDGEVSEIRLAGGSTGPLGAFEVLFRVEEPRPETDTSAQGEGELEVADGRRLALRSAQARLASDGSAQLRFTGDTTVTLAGRWYSSWDGAFEIAIDRVNSSSARGGGTIRFAARELDKIEIAVTPDGSGSSPLWIRFESAGSSLEPF